MKPVRSFMFREFGVFADVGYRAEEAHSVVVAKGRQDGSHRTVNGCLQIVRGVDFLQSP